jgi:hypothetical protein
MLQIATYRSSGRCVGSAAVTVALTPLLPVDAGAHRSACHRWHSCPSDTGSYMCGDLGYCSGCPDNQYCEAGQPKRVKQDATPGRPGKEGVPPTDAWNCPTSHPIKGNFTTYSGEPCIYHVPRGQFCGKTKPERSYASEEEALRDGCRKSRR